MKPWRTSSHLENWSIKWAKLTQFKLMSLNRSSKLFWNSSQNQTWINAVINWSRQNSWLDRRSKRHQHRRNWSWKGNKHTRTRQMLNQVLSIHWKTKSIAVNWCQSSSTRLTLSKMLKCKAMRRWLKRKDKSINNSKTRKRKIEEKISQIIESKMLNHSNLIIM